MGSRWTGALLIAAVMLGGCTQTRWENPTADADMTAAALAECDQAANLAARQQVMFERLSGPRPVRGGVIGYPSGGGGFYERNNEWLYTQQYFDQCMRSRGYRLVRVE